MNNFDTKKYPIFAKFLNQLAKDLTNFYYSKLNSKEDFLTPWLKFILNFFGIKKVETISADQMALDYRKSIKDAEKQIDKIIL